MESIKKEKSEVTEPEVILHERRSLRRRITDLIPKLSSKQEIVSAVNNLRKDTASIVSSAQEFKELVHTVTSDDKKTLFVNVYGAPGAGKSVASAGVYADLSLKGVNIEHITEYAKDLIWQESLATLRNQVYIFGMQYQRMWSLDGKVDVVVTDSPLLLNTIYDCKHSLALKAVVAETDASMNTLNILVKRTKAYEGVGRVHTEEQSKCLHEEIKKMLDAHSVEYVEMLSDSGTIAKISALVLAKIAQK